MILQNNILARLALFRLLQTKLKTVYTTTSG